MSRYVLSKLTDKAIANNQVIVPSKAIAVKLKVPHYSLESLAQTIIRQQGQRIAPSLLSLRILQNVVREIVKTKDIEGTARCYLPTIRELLRSGVDLTALQQFASSRVKQLANITLAYQQELQSQGYIDRGELFWQGSKLATNSSSYLFYGYFMPRQDEITFINQVAAEESVFVSRNTQVDRGIIANSREAIEFLREQGWSVNRSIEEASNSSLGKQLQGCFLQQQPLPHGAILHTYDNLAAEVRGVLAQVKILLSQRVKARDIVLVAREEELYGETLIDVAWEYQLTVRALYETPLEQTRIGAWLKLLLEVIEKDFPFEATAQLLAHPLVKLIDPETWTQARQIKPNGHTAWQKLGLDLELLDFPQSLRSREFWCALLQNILTAWDVLEKGKRWARETVAFYRLQEALAELSQPPKVKISRGVFIRDLQDTLSLLTVPAQPGRGGVELHTPASLLGTKYQYVFVLGTAEGIFPAAIKDNVILDFFSRKQLSRKGFPLETAQEIASREAAYFYHLLEIPSKEIVFSYPQLIGKNSILPSAYLNRLQLRAESIPDLPVASIEVARRLYLKQPEIINDPIIDRIIRNWKIQSCRETEAIVDEYSGAINISIPPQSKIFSASQLTQLGQCPFKWFSARLLKLKELTEADLDLSSRFRGNLYHRCLELSLEEIKTARDLEQFNRQQLEKAFFIAETELELHRLTGWEAQREEHLNLLALNFTSEAFLPPEREVFERETTFKTLWYGLQVTGTVDRIDRADGKLTIIDYKTSSSPPAGVQDATGKANLDIQLNLYRDAIAKTYPQDAIAKAEYYSLTQRKIMSRPKTNPEDLASFANKVKSHLEQGYYPVEPDMERKACQYCAFDLVCRKQD